jgi:uncharacterized protein with LGFP repeats
VVPFGATALAKASALLGAKEAIHHAVGRRRGRDGAGAGAGESTDGYFRQYKQGRIYWRDDQDDAYAVRGAIAEYHLANGGTGGELGFPAFDERSS